MSGRMPDDAEKRAIWSAMRVPVFSFVALLVMLGCIVLIGQVMPGRTGSFLETGLTICMAITVLLFSMEVRLEAPLMRFYAVLSFCWLAILIGMTMLDYLTR